VIAGFYQAAFVVTSAGVVLIDAPPSLADKLPAAIKSVTSKPVTYVILTHDHYDHIGAATRFAGAKLVAHELTAQLLSVYPDPERPIPTITFSGAHHTLNVGGERFELIYPGPNHETGNIIVYVPQEKLAVMTDLVMPGWVPYRGWGNADHIPGILKAHDALLELDFDTYVGGHVYRTGTRRSPELDQGGDERRAIQARRRAGERLGRADGLARPGRRAGDRPTGHEVERHSRRG
jgi:glyoxylase-like metal-dependent hydrolase (beta-lactamase superfamily II)